ncbi:hypothetical protein SAMN02745165_01961 [Malonomonas rubra DSM 5091]|uniref:Uncharacterized protein n=1 Tax=Malonomonas rubra DSM 5091 TaxID=1122189 RepID=A0A1M6I0V1_MALRU|nr:hypothetical protein [Malonomonas rubra]SHJ28057.1 hypothetical protein SAMN02745165_01961 [Malonomonas rubra DSM 5091]
MLSKKNHPKIELKGWINVEGEECLISQVYQGYSLSGACEVVTNPERPINKDVGWDGEKWFFSKQEPLVNAAQTSRLKEFVDELKRERQSGRFFDKKS